MDGTRERDEPALIMRQWIGVISVCIVCTVGRFVTDVADSGLLFAYLFVGNKGSTNNTRMVAYPERNTPMIKSDTRSKGPTEEFFLKYICKGAFGVGGKLSTRWTLCQMTGTCLTRTPIQSLGAAQTNRGLHCCVHTAPTSASSASHVCVGETTQALAHMFRLCAVRGR